MSYDIYFLCRVPGQSWETAMEAMESMQTLEDPSTATPEPPDAATWDEVVAQARELLGEVSTFGSPPTCSLDHRPTGLRLSCFSGQWSLTVPYWSLGDEATELMAKVFSLTEAVERLTGLEAYDPQAGEPVAAVRERGGLPVTDAFDGVAALFADLDGTSA